MLLYDDSTDKHKQGRKESAQVKERERERLENEREGGNIVHLAATTAGSNSNIIDLMLATAAVYSRMT